MNLDQQQKARQLLGVVGFRELVDVMSGVRPLMRVVLSGSAARVLDGIAMELGLGFEISPVAVEPVLTGPGCIHLHRSVLDRPLRDDDLRTVFVAADAVLAKIGVVLEKQDAVRFGRLCGYPECCIRFYDQSMSVRNPDLVFDIASPSGGRFDFFINPSCRAFGAGLISHFPCRWDCEPSHNLAERSLAALRATDTLLAGQMLSVLERDVLYSPQAIIAIETAEWQGSTLRLVQDRYMATAGLRADTIVFHSNRATLHHQGRTVRQLNPVRWLPFRSQHPVRFAP